MTDKPLDGTVRNSSGGLDGYTNEAGHFVWGNPAVVAEENRRQDSGLQERARRAATQREEDAKLDRGRER